MRTLIVDNVDSFTNNLVHAVALAGSEPTVVRNDTAWSDDLLAPYDRVIISPGPGSPARPEDVGLSAAVVLNAQVPVLGVCLGHQLICHLYGGVVGPAPEVRHGLLSSVEHDGAGVFVGLPSPLRAVRYHSLAVSSLPSDLEAVAWAEDGVLMGVRHRTRPLHGVQFHPESVCSEHGRRLVANFLGPATRPRRRRPAPAAVEPYTHRVLARRLPPGPSAEAVFETLYAGSEHAYWLDGAEVSVLGDGVPTSYRAGEFFDSLAADLAGRRVEVPALPFDFALGRVGYLGYELKSECGGEAAHSSAHPDAVLLAAERAVVVDRATEELWLLALAAVHHEREATAWLDETEVRLKAPAEPGPLAARFAARVVVRDEPEAYISMIEECQRLIDAGETYEVCLTTTLSAEADVDPWQAYRLLRAANPAPHAAYLRLGGLSVLSCSPELFLRVRPDGSVRSEPIKGTRPRSADPVHDVELREELRTSRKERAENLMIVDLVRHDLSAVCEPGTVEVDPLFAVRSYATAHQLVSTVHGRLRPDATAVDCVRAAFPPGSMTGAPKVRTMQILDRLEGAPRGVYSGAIGFFSYNGAADLSVVIRTAVVSENGIEYGVGGAVTALSEPAAEVAETQVKALPLRSVVTAE